ncbi:unnamed protein product, partial [Mesorhabditis spiculigera]
MLGCLRYVRWQGCSQGAVFGIRGGFVNNSRMDIYIFTKHPDIQLFFAETPFPSKSQANIPFQINITGGDGQPFFKMGSKVEFTASGIKGPVAHKFISFQGKFGTEKTKAEMSIEYFDSQGKIINTEKFEAHGGEGKLTRGIR